MRISQENRETGRTTSHESFRGKETGAQATNDWANFFRPPAPARIDAWLLPFVRTGPALTAVVVSPHPDDAELGVGAFVRWLVEHGVRVVVVVLYPGWRCPSMARLPMSPRQKTCRRVDENRRAVRKTGAELVFLDLDAYDSQDYEPTPDDLKKFRKVLSELRPAVVFIPPRFDWHLAHQAARATIAKCIRKLTFVPDFVTYLPPWSGLGGETPPTLFFPYGRRLAAVKRSAIEVYESQKAGTDVLELVEHEDRVWALRLPEIIDRHRSESTDVPPSTVACEVFRREVLDPVRAHGRYADPIHVALLEIRRNGPYARRPTEGIPVLATV